MNQIEQGLIHRYPLGNLHPGYFIIHPQVEEIDRMLPIVLLNYIASEIQLEAQWRELSAPKEPNAEGGEQ